jgi:hypothetical protein
MCIRQPYASDGTPQIRADEGREDIIGAKQGDGPRARAGLKPAVRGTV